MNIKIVSFLLALSLAPMAHANYSAEASSSEYSETARPRDPRGPRGPRGPGWPGGPRHHRWECASQNARGLRFIGVDRNRNWAQREAQNRCLRRSRICRPIGCRAVR